MLASLSAKYEYADCLSKVEQITQRGAVITRGDEGKEVIILPDAFDGGDRITGACVEITAKNLRDISLDWLKEVNEANNANGRPELRARLVEGSSKTHFIGENTHHWVALGPKNATPDEMITIDGSFLEISKQGANGYSPKHFFNGVESHTLMTDDLLDLGDIDADNKSWNIGLPDTSVIGLTHDRKHAVNLGFAIDRSLDEAPIRPVFYIAGENGTSQAFCMRIGENIFWGDEDDILEEAHVTEISELLEVIEKIQISEDFSASRDYWRRTTTVHFS